MVVDVNAKAFGEAKPTDNQELVASFERASAARTIWSLKTLLKSHPIPDSPSREVWATWQSNLRFELFKSVSLGIKLVTERFDNPWELLLG
jgi:hypothetical protein